MLHYDLRERKRFLPEGEKKGSDRC
jgi:hypothetical protein